MSKMLGDFLQEQQEPFALQVFLVERGIEKKRELVTPNCSAFLKAVFKLQFGRNLNKLQGSNATQNSRRPSSVSSSSAATYTSDTHSQCAEPEVGANRKVKGRSDTNCKQLSPVSVLDETNESSDQDSPIRCMLHRLLAEEERGSSDSSSFHRYNNNRLKDVVEPSCCSRLWIWSKHSNIDGSNILNLLHSDFLASQTEWNAANFEHQKMEIFNELHNAIFEDVINEIVLVWPN